MDEATRTFHRFTRPPFGPVTSPGEAFLSRARIDVAISVVERMRDGGNVVAVLRGSTGAGKTVFAMLLAAMLQESGVPTVQIPPDERSPMQIHARLAAFGGLPDGSVEPGAMLQAMLAERRMQRLTVLVDDADSLPAESFRYLWQLLELRFLEATQVHLVLLGQPGRWEGLHPPDLENLRHAVFGGHMMRGLNDADAAAYLRHRLHLAGRPGRRVVSRAVQAEVIARSGGMPGRINELMDAAFAAAHLVGSRRITLKHLRQPGVHEAERRRAMPGLKGNAAYWRPASIVLGSLAVSACVAALIKLDSAASPQAGPSPQDKFAILAGRSPAPPAASPKPELPAPADSASNEASLAGTLVRPRALPPEPSVLAPRLARIVVPPSAEETTMTALDGTELQPAAPTPTPLRLASRLARIVVPPSAEEAIMTALDGTELQPAAPTPTPLRLASRLARIVDPPSVEETTMTALDGTELRQAAPTTTPLPLASRLARVTVAATPEAAAPIYVALASTDLRPATPSPKPTLPPSFAPRTVAPAPQEARAELALPPRPAPPGLAFPAAPGDSLQSLYVRIYHGVTPPPFAVFAAANPAPVQAGNIVFFPDPPGGWVQPPSTGR